MKLVILDRDGVINHESEDFIRTPAEWIPLPGALEAIARLNHAGWRVAVATNQSGLARGLFGLDDFCAINDKMLRQCAELGGHIEGVFFCPHGPNDDCSCRKPRPGLLHEIARRLQFDLRGVPVIGDSLRDLEAAHSAGATPMLVRTGNGAKTETQARAAFPDLPVHDDLTAAVAALLRAGKLD